MHACNACMYGWMYGWMDRWMDGWMASSLIDTVVRLLADTYIHRQPAATAFCPAVCYDVHIKDCFTPPTGCVRTCVRAFVRSVRPCGVNIFLRRGTNFAGRHMMATVFSVCVLSLLCCCVAAVAVGAVVDDVVRCRACLAWLATRSSTPPTSFAGTSSALTSSKVGHKTSPTPTTRVARQACLTAHITPRRHFLLLLLRSCCRQSARIVSCKPCERPEHGRVGGGQRGGGGSSSSSRINILKQQKAMGDHSSSTTTITTMTLWRMMSVVWMIWMAWTRGDPCLVGAHHHHPPLLMSIL